MSIKQKIQVKEILPLSLQIRCLILDIPSTSASKGGHTCPFAAQAAEGNWTDSFCHSARTASSRKENKEAIVYRSIDLCISSSQFNKTLLQ